MKMKAKLQQIWRDQAPGQHYALLKRLLIKTDSAEIYAITKTPRQHHGIAFPCAHEIQLPATDLSDIHVFIVQTELSSDALLCITLENKELEDIFSTLCEDLILHVIEKPNKEKISALVLLELHKWIMLFKKIFPRGVSQQLQQGLYGELYFLRKLLTSTSNRRAVLELWMGPEQAPHDFLRKNYAVEVKCSSHKLTSAVLISNVQQLDESYLEKLYLYHLVVKSVNDNGERLAEIIKSVKSLLRAEAGALAVYSLKLMQVGFQEDDIELYMKRGYTVLRENYFCVRDHFPRIKENELRIGITKLNYGINLDCCQEYIVKEKELIESMTHDID